MSPTPSPNSATSQASPQHLLEHLNPAQKSAVTSQAKHLLILAGAGTGKTRALIHRIAWLLQSGQAGGGDLMAVTFTNKAANELKERLLQLIGPGPTLARIQAGTFHSMARRHLGQHGEAIGLQSNFSIIDTDDQKRLARSLMRQEGVNEKHYPPNEFISYINRHKEEGIRATGAAEHTVYSDLYALYESHCRQENLVDFGELLLAAYEMLRDCPEVRDYYQQRYSHLLVDEFQDTNAMQYQWLQLLTGNDTRTTVVGDDDQTIYTWRGARSENMHEYAEHFGAEIVKLERNYRSTSHILSAADCIIQKNTNRLGKTLVGNKDDGDKICIYSAYNEQDEARFASSIIEDWHSGNNRLSDVAILYRSNVLSRMLEEEMVRSRIPYRIYGGTRFYSRIEIKDTLAWLRLVHNPHEDMSFLRALGSPKRGLGEKAVEHLRALGPDQSLWNNCKAYINAGGRKSDALKDFTQTVEGLRRKSGDLPLHKLVQETIARSGLLALYQKIQGEGGLSKEDNLHELVRAAEEFEKKLHRDRALLEHSDTRGDARSDAGQEEPTSVLEQFLTDTALNAGDQQATSHLDYVHLMTLHASKGLEFPLVLIIGMEEELFPHIRSLQEQGLEEERRLCYVGMTRAMDKLYMTWAQSRRGQSSGYSSRRMSRFLYELPGDLVQRAEGGMPAQDYANGNGVAESRGSAADNSNGRGNGRGTGNGGGSNGAIRAGLKVQHKTFGCGTVLHTRGEGGQEQVKVQFDEHGVKWLLLSHAQLTLST